MGYKKQSKLYKLKFDDPDMNGLEVTVRKLSVGKILENGRKEAEAKASDDNAVLLSLQMGILAEVLVEWNLEDEDGAPVPATYEGVLTQDMDFVLEILKSMGEALYGVSAPLADSSTSGETFQEALIPMETLSENPSS